MKKLLSADDLVGNELFADRKFVDSVREKLTAIAYGLCGATKSLANISQFTDSVKKSKHKVTLIKDRIDSFATHIDNTINALNAATEGFRAIKDISEMVSFLRGSCPERIAAEIDKDRDIVLSDERFAKALCNIRKKNSDPIRRMLGYLSFAALAKEARASLVRKLNKLEGRMKLSKSKSDPEYRASVELSMKVKESIKILDGRTKIIVDKFMSEKRSVLDGIMRMSEAICSNEIIDHDSLRDVVLAHDSTNILDTLVTLEMSNKVPSKISNKSIK